MIDDYACILYYNSWVTLLVCGQLTQTVGGAGITNKARDWSPQ